MTNKDLPFPFLIKRIGLKPKMCRLGQISGSIESRIFIPIFIKIGSFKAGHGSLSVHWFWREALAVQRLYLAKISLTLPNTRS
jgi:hypothetical protein